MAAYEFQQAFLDALIEQAFVRDDDVKTMVDAWVRLGQRMGPAVQKLADSSAPALEEIPIQNDVADLDGLITMESSEWDGMAAEGSQNYPGVSDSMGTTTHPPTTQNPAGAASASTICIAPAALTLSPLTTIPSANNPGVKSAISHLCDGVADLLSTNASAKMSAVALASVPGDEDAKSDTNSDMDRSSDPDADADADGEADANANQDADANADATIAPNARVNDKPNHDSDSDLDLTCAPDSDADVRIGRDASAKAAESDSDLTSMESSFPSPVRELRKKSSTRTAASAQKSSALIDSDAPMSDVESPPRLKKTKGPKGKGVRLSLKRKRSSTPDPPQPTHIKALSLRPLLKKQRLNRLKKNARRGAMSAAFPVNPLEKGDYVALADLLEPSIEPATAGGSELDAPLPHGPLNLLTLELPTAVYDVEADEVKMELQPFQFPYAAQVRYA